MQFLYLGRGRMSIIGKASGTDIRTIKQQMGHNTEQQTWDYIHEVIDAEERKNRLKGGNLLGNSQKPHKYALDAV